MPKKQDSLDEDKGWGEAKRLKLDTGVDESINTGAGKSMDTTEQEQSEEGEPLKKKIDSSESSQEEGKTPKDDTVSASGQGPSCVVPSTDIVDQTDAMMKGRTLK